MSSKKKSRKKKAAGGRAEESTQIYARVRGLMPWEPRKVSLAVEGMKKVRNKSGKITNEYDFKRVFKPNAKNEQVFKVIVMPLISNVLKGFNAVLIAYGQTGSGKTFSMLGKPKLGVVGLLPRMLAYMVDRPSVTKVELSAVEAFGHHVAKIELFDLYDPINQTQVWNDKKGNTSLDMMKARRVAITDADDAHEKIIYAHHGSHFAPTGKNPESSRGHVTFVAKISQQLSKHESKVSYFVMVDCAGSEGETAFTPEFKARVDKDTLMARRLEAGTINTGLSELQVIFNQLKSKGQLAATIGNGLRRVLHPYINTQTYLSVLFTLSPSVNNAKATESTLKFAVTAGMVKVKPVATKGKINWENLARELKAHLAKQEAIIVANNDQIEDVERQMARINQAMARAKRGLPVTKKKKGKKGKQKVSKAALAAAYGGDAGVIEVSPRMEPRTADAQSALSAPVDGGMMDVLDDSIMDLMAELDPDFRGELEKEKERKKAEEKASKKDGRHTRESSRVPAGGRARTMTAEENDEAMQAGILAWKKAQGRSTAKASALAAPRGRGGGAAGKPGSLKKRQSRQVILESMIATQEKEIKKLKALQQRIEDEKEAENLSKDDLEGHAMDLNILLAEQKSITKGLEQSRQIILDFLEADGRQALVQFFKMKKLV